MARPKNVKEMDTSFPRETKTDKPSKESYLVAVLIESKVDIPNYGKIVPATYKKAAILAKELDDAYEVYC